MNGIDPALIDQLEATVESRHRHALQAIKTLREYLSADEASPQRPYGANPVIGELISFLRGDGSIRERVRRSISEQFKSIEEIVDETGLTNVQVRGVLYAKDFRPKVQRDRSSGPMRFRLTSGGA